MLCELAQNWADWDATKRHYELMARFVHPHFQKSRDLLRGSYDYAVGHRDDFVGRASAAIQKEIDRHAARARAGEAGSGGVDRPLSAAGPPESPGEGSCFRKAAGWPVGGRS